MYAFGACNCFVDLMFAIFIPFPIIYKLQVNKRTKASAMFVLSTGLIAVVASIFRIPSLVNYGSTGDYLWDVAEIAKWSIIETNMAMIAGCMPALRPLITSILDSQLVRSFTKATGRSQGDTSTSTHRNTYPESKSFEQISEQQVKPGDFDDISERSLIHNQTHEVVPMGSIHRTVVSTIHTSVNAESSPKPYDPSRQWDKAFDQKRTGK